MEDTHGFGDIVAKNLSLDAANKLRKKILTTLKRRWVYVLNSGGGKCSVSVANYLGNKLTPEELLEVKNLLNQ